MDEREQRRLTMERAVQENLYDANIYLERADHWDYAERLTTLRAAQDALTRAADEVEAYMATYGIKERQWAL